MKTTKLIKTTIPVFAGMLFLDLGLNSLSVLAQSDSTVIPVSEVQPLTPVEGTAADLSNLETQNNQTGSWGMGGENYPNSNQSSYQIKTESGNSLIIFEQNQEDQELHKLNHGDVPSQGATVPVSRF